MAPKNGNGTVKVMDFIPEIHKVMQPLGNSLYRKEDRILKAINRIEELKKEVVNVKADDAHNLFGVNEIHSMLICAELFFRSSLLRKETRGWFQREDYPERDDSVIKWYTMQNIDGKMVSGEEIVPIDRYVYKPAPITD